MRGRGVTCCLALFMLSACGDGAKDSDKGRGDGGTEIGGTDPELEAELRALGQKCQFSDLAYSIEDETDRCIAKCFLDSDCAAIKELECSDMPSEDSAVIVCILGCPEAPADGFACKDGAKVPHLALCDGTDDCDDGGDEVSCAEFKCANGESVVEDVTCDGSDDCADGSDEKDCPNVCN